MAEGSDGLNIGHSQPSTASVRPIDQTEDGIVDLLDQEQVPKKISGGPGNAGIPFNERWNRQVPPGEPPFQISNNGG